MTDGMATTAHVRDGIALLGRYTNRPLSDEALALFVGAFAGKVPYRRFAEGVQRWMEAHGPASLPPSVQDLAAMFREIRDSEWQREKLATPTMAQAAERQRDPDVAVGLRMLAQYCQPHRSWTSRAQLAVAFSQEWHVVEPWMTMAADCVVKARQAGEPDPQGSSQETI